MLFRNLVINLILITGIILTHFPIFASGIYTDKSSMIISVSNSDSYTFEKGCIHSDNTDSSKFCVIVRYPVHGNKLVYLKKQMDNPGNPLNKSAQYKGLYDKAIEENSKNFNTLFQLFSEHFDATPFYFLPDSSYKAFNSGIAPAFVNMHEVTDLSLTCPYDNYYFIITGKDEDQLLFVTRQLNRAPEPLPYKKNIFLPSFKKIFNRNGYLTTQIKYFNEQLKQSNP